MTRPINIYFIWYGGGASGFTEAQKNIFRDVTASFSSGGDAANTGEGKGPCVCCKLSHRLMHFPMSAARALKR